MPTVTAVREERGRRHVTVELDGARWRTLPVDAVVRAGLGEGVELDRARARTLARELRRSKALALSINALRHRLLSERALSARLDRAGVPPASRAGALATLREYGLVDDERLAQARASSLAERGLGDAAIRWELERSGVAADRVGTALACLEAERVRARRIADRRGRTGATARFLARRGFGDEAIEDAVGPLPGIEE